MSAKEVASVLSHLKPNELRQLTKEYGFKYSKQATKNDLITGLLYPFKNLKGGAVEEVEYEEIKLVEPEPETIPWDTLPEPILRGMLEKMPRADIGRLRIASKKLDDRLKQLEAKGDTLYKDLIKGAPWSIQVGVFNEVPVFDIAWHPNGREIASLCAETIEGEEQATIMIWNINDGKQVGKTMVVSVGGMGFMDWSARGNYLAGGDSEIEPGIIIWEAETQEMMYEEINVEFVGAHVEVNTVAWNPTDEPILASVGDNISIWDTENNTLLGSMNLINPVSSLAWHPEGVLLASGGINDIRIWNSQNFQQIGRTINSSANTVIWNPIGTILASGSLRKSDKGIIQFWNSETQTLINSIKTSKQIFSLAWHPDNQRIASGDNYGNIIIWDSQTGQKIEILQKTPTVNPHWHAIYSLAWSPQTISPSSDKRYLAAGDYTRILLWAR